MASRTLPENSRFARRLPLTPAILERTYQFLLFCVHRNDGLTPLLKPLHGGAYKLELSIAVWMRFSFFRLAIALQAVPVRVQQPAYRSGTDRMPHPPQFLCQVGCAFACPAQWRTWITARQRLDHPFSCLRQSGVSLDTA